MATCCCFSCPEQETVHLVESFGKFNKIAEPGCHFIPCCLGAGINGTLSLRVQQLDVRCETKTLDNVFLTLVISVQYQVDKEKAFDAFYKLTDSRQQISSYIFDVVRATVPKMNLDDVFTAKEEVANEVRENLTKAMSGYGYIIIAALVNDIEPDAKVKSAMNEINAARRLRVAALEHAEAQKVTMVKAAEAEAEAKFLQGQGIARQRQAIISGFADSIKDFNDNIEGMNAKSVMELMLITQYFDTLKEIGNNSKTNTVFLNHAPASMSDVSQQMRSSFLEASAGKSK